MHWRRPVVDVKLAFVMLGSSDLDRAIAFYSEMIGLRMSGRFGISCFSRRGGRRWHSAGNSPLPAAMAPRRNASSALRASVSLRRAKGSHCLHQRAPPDQCGKLGRELQGSRRALLLVLWPAIASGVTWRSDCTPRRSSVRYARQADRTARSARRSSRRSRCWPTGALTLAGACRCRDGRSPDDDADRGSLRGVADTFASSDLPTTRARRSSRPRRKAARRWRKPARLVWI